MANITFKYKGTQTINLTRHYNSLSVYHPNIDNIGFNADSNGFSDYFASSTCGIWQNDKIKILSLPNKGRLFYLTNPNSGTPIYADVIVDQLILVRDLNDNKVLKFQGEGTDGQFTGNYLTNFTFERFCATTGSNIVVTVQLNMLDDLVAESNIYIDSIVQINGKTNYNLHVENANFIGYACTRIISTTNIKNCSSTFSTYGNTVAITGATDGQVQDSYVSLNIPIGVYPCEINVSYISLDGSSSSFCQSKISYGTSTDFLTNAIVIDAYKSIVIG